MTATIEASTAAATADSLISSFVLTGEGPNLDITPAIVGDPKLTRTIDGGSSFALDLADYRYALANHPKFGAKFYADMGGFGYEGVAVDGDENRLTVTFEDAVSVVCKRLVPARKIDKSTMTRQQIARAMLADVGPVELLIEDDGRGVVTSDVERAKDKTTWDLLGELASDIGWRRFSDGRRVVMGSDAWLATLSTPAVFRPYTGPVHGVRFGLDVAAPASECSLDVDALSWTLPPGRSFSLDGVGLASGDWLITQYERGLYSLRATITGQRRQTALPEPPPEQTAVAGEAGESGNLPVSTSKATPSGSSTGLGRIADIAIDYASRGLPYIWGGKNIAKGVDCSGFVAAVMAKYGKPLAGGSKQQWATGRARGRVVSVQEGLRTRGAVLVRMNTEPSHIGISLGDGRTAEARGKKYGVKVFGGASGRAWTGAFIWES